MTQSYQRRCKICAEMVHMEKCVDDKWRAFDFPDLTKGGTWRLHNFGRWGCSGRWE